MSKSSKKRQKSPIKDIRDARIISSAATGKSIKEIAAEVGCYRSVVAKTLTSDQAREIVTHAHKQVFLLVDKAVEALDSALEKDANPYLRQNAALAVLKHFGVIRDRAEKAGDADGVKAKVSSMSDAELLSQAKLIIGEQTFEAGTTNSSKNSSGD